MKIVNRSFAILILLLAQAVFGENWRLSGRFVLPNVPIGNTELGTNIRIITINNTNHYSPMLGNVALAYAEASTTATTSPRPIRVKRMTDYNGGGSSSSLADVWANVGSAGSTSRGFSFTGYAGLEEYNYEIGGTNLLDPILGCFDAPCASFTTLGVTGTVTPQIDVSYASPNAKSHTDMVSDSVYDYFAYPDQTQGGKVTVVRRQHNSGPQSAGAWEVLGQPGISAVGTVAHVRLTRREGFPLRLVVAVENGLLSSIQVFRLSPVVISGQPPFAMWFQEGNTIFTSHVLLTIAPDSNAKYYAHPDLEINNAGIPFLLHTRKTTAAEGGMIQSTVKKLNAGEWQTVGNAFLGNSTSESNVCTDMTFNTFNDRLHVGCINFFNIRPMVRVFNGNQWTGLGDIPAETGFSACVPLFPPADTSITHDRATNALFFAFSSCGNSDASVVVVAKDLD
ncbi:hypothetical protein EHQ12_00750 [Leptospira gomenensis]|uniref:Uncharacterized protein n=1 Tax=Leptospira gomenensis TaxID=2484974 RepID=A0A5F1YFT9_9LEPT|nr:hypothetical protein [Leptospira gomenensis]TGK39221.1 hypothetical protein EHQ17_00650 [Leptospira gomenensis]TGK44239.1 hypothetical protein EHQ07_12055 [Leptospira gomenensis]TGK45092.1 hypothetical protein EHQ12_00750 [Leptospira gomenensis]TGK65101.1 hypothetical protein EHQ13_06030 [Leptospira gomenensis]